MYVSIPLQAQYVAQQRTTAGFVPDIRVYEEIPVDLARWEYQVLSIDTKQRALPDEERLNELGREGWLLVSVLSQGQTGDVALVHYYFVRQIITSNK